ncbi:hypothetical protein ACFVU3_14435 [Streptomyces sp. NPDC058052]|uniref:hypothetical protein n=1 Tax=Streptomyces sp. NPDC058052 TaxID=3346316 RepID=UPI0036E65ED3
MLGAGFLAAVGGSLDEFDSPNPLAAYAGVAPRPRTRARSSATCTGRSSITEDSSASSPPPRSSAPATTELTEVLRPQARRSEEARPGRARPRPPTRRRHLGLDIRDCRFYRGTPPVTAAARLSGHA